MANQGGTIAVIIIGAVLIVALFTAGPILGGIGDLIAQFREDFLSDWGDNDLFDGDKDNNVTTYGFNGLGYLGATIRYEDGSTRQFTFDAPYSIFPLTIWDNYGYIESITIEAWVTTEFSSSPLSYSIAGTLNIKIGDVDETMTFIPLYDCASKTIHGSEYTIPLESGIPRKMWETTITKATIEGWFESAFPEAPHYWANLGYFADDVTIEYEWEDGHTEDATLSAYSTHTLNWYKGDLGETRLQSVTLTINPSQLYT